MKYATFLMTALLLLCACSNRSASTSTATETPSGAVSAESASPAQSPSPEAGASSAAASPAAGPSTLSVSYDDISGVFGSNEITQLAIPDWKDKQDISPEYVGPIATGEWDDKGAPAKSRIDNVPRTFGAIAMFHPKASLTRVQAAIMLWKIDPHARSSSTQDAARTAADALAPVSASPTP